VSEYDVRVAAFDELDVATAYQLWQLRSQVFVVEQECAYLDLDGRDAEPGTSHVWAAPQGSSAPVACLRVLDDGTAARVGRVAVAPAHRGRGLAARLMREAHRLTDGRPVVLDAQAHLEPWYARLGYVPTGPEFLDDGIPHVPMRRG
jgi:ElaA protein